MRKALLDLWRRWNAMPDGWKAAIRIGSTFAMAMAAIGGGFFAGDLREGFFAGDLHILFIHIVLLLPAAYGLTSIGFAAGGNLGFGRLAFILGVGAFTAISAHAALYYKNGLCEENGARCESALVMPMSDNGTRETPTVRDAMYFSVLTFTTLGYGDIRPEAPYRIAAALEALYGYVFLGLLVGLLANAASSGRDRSE